eukprot:XP_014786313.1 PREDICTED: sporozoite surface protein 2-like isoform X2 [Octopus bimaculoides]
MEGNGSNTVSNIHCSGSSPTNFKNSREHGICVFHHDDDEALASDVVDQISKVSKCKCNLYNEINTRKNKIFDHLSEITQKCSVIVLLITENMENDERTQHLRDELIRMEPNRIVIIENRNVKQNDFGISSYRKIDWQKSNKEKKIEKYFKDIEPESTSLVPPKSIIYVQNAIMQAGHNNVVNVFGATEKPRDLRELLNPGMNKTEPNEVELNKAEPNKVELNTAGLNKAEPNKAETNKVEPSKAEPNKVEPSKAEPHNAELHKAEPNKVELNKVEPNKAEPNKAELNKVEPSKAEPHNTELRKVELNKVEPNKAEPSKAELSKAEPSKVELNKAELNKVEPNKPELGKAEPNKVELNKVEPNKAEPNKAELNKAELNKAEPNNVVEPNKG